MRKENSVLIKINDWEKLKRFAAIVTKIESDINIYHGSGYYDAKSILAIIALGIDKPRYVEIISNNEEEIKSFKEQMSEFIVEG